MAKLRQWLKMLLCRITGGHKYKDTGLESHYDRFNKRFRFGNRCVKCGDYSAWYVPEEALFEEVDNRVEMHTVKQGMDGDAK